MRRVWKWCFVLLGAVLLALFIAVMLMVAYPNALKVSAPFLCPDDKPDAFVVRYDVETSDGTGTNFTLFCMSDRGEIEEVGTWAPLLYLFGFVAAILFALLLLRVVLGIIRRIASDGDPGTGPPMGPGDPMLMTPEQILGASAPPPPGENPFES